MDSRLLKNYLFYKTYLAESNSADASVSPLYKLPIPINLILKNP